MLGSPFTFTHLRRPVLALELAVPVRDALGPFRPAELAHVLVPADVLLGHGLELAHLALLLELHVAVALQHGGLLRAALLLLALGLRLGAARGKVGLLALALALLGRLLLGVQRVLAVLLGQRGLRLVRGLGGGGLSSLVLGGLLFGRGLLGVEGVLRREEVVPFAHPGGTAARALYARAAQRMPLREE